jgi:hypothetical protein
MARSGSSECPARVFVFNGPVLSEWRDCNPVTGTARKTFA